MEVLGTFRAVFREGYPNSKRLFKDSVYDALRSIVPPVTSDAWLPLLLGLTLARLAS